MPTARILIVEDEANIRFFLTNLLQGEGYETSVAANGQAALAQIAAGEFDLAILDLNLGSGIGGMEVLATLRQQSPDTGVILLTGYATLETAIEALRQGARDYLLKPSQADQIRQSVRQALLKRESEQQPRALLAQLEQTLASSLAEIRTVGQENDPSPTPVEPARVEERFLRRSGLVIDLARHAVTVDDHSLEVSPAEFDFLAYLASQSPRVVSSEEIIRQVYKYETGLLQDSDAVRALVYRLRLKIKQSCGRTDIIRTVRGVGYAIGE